MSASQEIIDETGGIVSTAWTERDGRVIPDPASIRLGNDAVKLHAVVLYADLAGSTTLVDTYTPAFCAVAFKTFLTACARLVRYEDGAITAYDGDRIMAVFHGDRKNTQAVHTALRINWSVLNVINPALKRRFTDLPADFAIKHGVGIARSDLFIVQTGIRGNNDLAWMGPASNWAAKMSNIRDEGYSTFISENVYEGMTDASRYSPLGENMWENRTWKGKTVYRSSWWAVPEWVGSE